MSLKPLRAKRRSRKHPRLVEGGNWNFHPLSFHWNPSARFSKVLMLSLIIAGIALVPLYGYYHFQVQPALQNGNRDPFTTIWNGQIPNTFSTQNAGSSTITFNSKVNATGARNANSPISLPAITVTSGDTIIVTLSSRDNTGVDYGKSTTVTDTQSNTYTTRVFIIGQACCGFDYNTFVYTAKASATGSNTITLNNPLDQIVYTSLVGLDYSGVKGFGNIANQTYTSSSQTGTNSLSITTATTGSVILETYAGGSASATTLASPNSGQTIRNDFIAVVQTSDKTGISGSNSQSYNWNNPSLNCSAGSLCGFTFVMLELTNTQSAILCEQVGYHCSNSSIINGDINLNATSGRNAVVLDTSQIDLSTGVNKSIAFGQLITASPCSPQCANSEVAWFLTVNGTTVTNNSTLNNLSLLNYNPLNDTSVALEVLRVWTSTTSVNYYVYMQRTLGQASRISGQSDNPYSSGTCPQSSTIFLCTVSTHGTNAGSLSLALNFTGNSNGSGNGESYLCIDAGAGSTTCQLGGKNNVQVNLANTNFAINFTQPWINIQQKYYLGYWSSSPQIVNSPTVVTSDTVGSTFSPVISLYTPSGSGKTNGQDFFGWIGSSLGGAWNQVAGALAPITNPVFAFGNSLLSVFISGLIQAGNLLIKGLTVLESIMVSVMNTIGNFLGWGNVGTSMQQLINAMVTLFTNGSVATFFGDLPTVVSRFIDYINVAIPWLPIAFNIASNVILLGVNAIVFIPTLVKFIFFWVSGVFVIVLIVFWFIYTGDDALGGMLAFLETAEWFIFGLGVGLVSNIVNFFLDIVTYLIGLIPKPLVQMVAHAMPRLPIVQTGAHFISPSFDLGEVRAGNMLSILSWMIGLTFLDWYEQVTPALPGSIGSLLPSAASALTPLTGLLPLLEIITALTGAIALIFWPMTKIMEYALGDISGIPVTMGPGRRLNAGPSGISVRTATKRFQGRLEKKLGKIKEESKQFETARSQIAEAEKAGLKI